MITSRDAESTCFKGSRTSCDVIIFGIFGRKIWPEKITSRDGCLLPSNAPSNSGLAFKSLAIWASKGEEVPRKRVEEGGNQI